MRVKIHNKSPYPVARATHGSAAIDLHANISSPRVINPGTRWKFMTGLHMEIPAGHAGQIWSRSGLCIHHGLGILDGVIDSDYRGEISVTLFNFDSVPYEVLPGDRVGQMVIVPVVTISPDFVELDELMQTQRGSGGLGSTGR